MVIHRGCQSCMKNEDVWLEACRLLRPDHARIVAAAGLECIPNSVELWLQAARLEHDDANKRDALMEGLNRIPESVRLWMALVELANEEDARILLHRAVECCPLHVELWIALVRLETCENAKVVLNMARKKLPKEPAIWITAAKLEEANGNTEKAVVKIIERGIRTLQDEGLVIDREAWMKEAEEAERAGSVATCRGIIKHTIGFGVEEEDRKRTWMADAEDCEKRGSIETTRAIYNIARSVFLTKKSIWLKAAQLEKSHGTRETLDALLSEAVRYMPQAEVLWLMGAMDALKKCDQDPHVIDAVAKLFWRDRKVDKARSWLNRAVTLAPDFGDYWALYYKFELQHGSEENQKDVLKRCVAAEPKHGEKWQAISKAVENSHRPTEFILKKLVIALGKEENAAGNNRH